MTLLKVKSSQPSDSHSVTDESIRNFNLMKPITKRELKRILYKPACGYSMTRNKDGSVFMTLDDNRWSRVLSTEFYRVFSFYHVNRGILITRRSTL